MNNKMIIHLIPKLKLKCLYFSMMLFLSFLSILLNAQQTCSDQWAYKIEASLTNIANPEWQSFDITDIQTDMSGNIYTTGIFKGTVDFDPSAALYSLSAPIDHFSCFVMKTDSLGSFLWAKKIGGNLSTDECSGKNIRIDALGTIYVVGNFKGTVDFNPGASVNNYTCINECLFVLKLSSSGNFTWVKQFENASTNDICLDVNGNIFLCGLYNATTDFDPGSGVALYNASPNIDCFVLKLNSSGNFIWVKTLVGNSESYGVSLALDSSSNIIVTGRFWGTCDFNPSASVYNLTSSGLTDIFIWKLDPSGNFMWVKQIGSLHHDYVHSSVVDRNGNIYLSGNYDTTIDFNPSFSIYNLYCDSHNFATYILKLDNNGNFIWAKSIGSGTNDPEIYSSQLILDSTGSSYLVGHKLWGVINFDPNSLGLTSSVQTGTFILKQDSSGNGIAFKQITSTQGNSDKICLNPSEDILLSSYLISDTLQLDNTLLTESIGFDASFVFKIIFVQPPKNSTPASNITTCSGNSTTLSASGKGILGWYSAPTGGNYLGGGNTFITPNLTTNTTYYVQDSICIASQARTPITVIINSNTLPNVNSSASSIAFCQGLSTTLTASGSNIYTWMPGNLSGSSVVVSPTATTTYTVTGTNLFTGCYNTSTKTITVHPQPSFVKIVAASSTVCNGENITLYNSSIGATSYVWSTGAVNTPITITPSSTATYTVTASSSFACTKTATKTITVNSCSLTYTVKAFIEAYYIGGGLMRPVLLNQGVSGVNASKTDSIRLSLRSSVDPYEPIYSWNSLLQTNGNITRNFPSSGTYYITLQHRNGLETWSKNPVSISTFVPSYNFTTASNKAYGDNMVEVESGKWAIYSGDLNNDRNVDLLDLAELEADINTFQFGYYASDINGDGNVDLLDASSVEANVNDFIFSSQP